MSSLVLTRRLNEAIVVRPNTNADEDIIISVDKIGASAVRIRVTANEDTVILREEIAFGQS